MIFAVAVHSHGPRSFQSVWLSRLIPGISVIRFVLQWSSGTLGASSCHSCFLPLLERIAWDFCGVMLAVSSYHCLAARIGECLQAAVLQFTTASRKGLATYMFTSCRASVHHGSAQKGWRPTCLQAAVLELTMYHYARVGDLHASTGW